jgi:hypothetical protein
MCPKDEGVETRKLLGFGNGAGWGNKSFVGEKMMCPVAGTVKSFR